MNWISVEESLPAPMEDVLIYYRGDILIGHVDGENSFWWSDLYDFFRLNITEAAEFSRSVTHWMPLPAKP